MDNVDSIVIMTLRQAGCSIDEEISSLAQFTPEILMNCCAILLNMIDSTFEIPLTAPADGPKRFKHCNKIVQAMKKIGYRDDCRYDLFSYPNASDTRKFLSFLIERMPRAGQDEKEEVIQETGLFGEMTESIRRSFYQPWFLPPLQKPKPANHFLRHFSNPYDNITAQQEKDYWDELNEGRSNERQDTRRTAKKVVLRMLAAGAPSGGLGGLPQSLRDLRNKLGGRFVHVTKFGQEQEEQNTVSADTRETSEKEEREKQLKDAEEELENYTRALGNCDEQMNDENERQRDLAERARVGEQTKDRLEQEVKQKNLIVAMLQDPEGSKEKLEQLNTKTMGKIRRIGEEWEKVREPLVTEYHELMEKARGANSATHRLAEELKDVRKQMEDLIEEARKKQTRLVQMRQEYNGMDKAQERSTYVLKITDLHQTLSAQKKDIENIITDVRTLMTDSNSAELRRDRVFQEADELVYQTAQNDSKNEKDSPAKQIYAGLVKIHQNYRHLFLAYEEFGKLSNLMLDIKDRIEDQKQYDTEKKMAKLQQDYDEFTKDNERLRKRLEHLENLAEDKNFTYQ